MIIEVRGIALDRPLSKKRTQVFTRDSIRDNYRVLIWPSGKPLTPGTIKIEVAKFWKVDPREVVILDNVEIPKV